MFVTRKASFRAAFSVFLLGMCLTLSLLLQRLYRPIPNAKAELDLPAVFAGELQNLFAGVAEAVRPGVVSISFTKVLPVSETDGSKDFPRGKRELRQRSLGSGVIIDRLGYIVTNSHVVENSEDLKVLLWDGREFPARMIHQDVGADIALLRIDAHSLQEIPLGNSDDLRVGHWVLAIGSPFGLSQTVSAGIVSAVGRSGLGLLPYENFIQTDASINQGNSGGPLVDLQGRLVGINTAIFSNQSGSSFGIGFAVPINLANALVQKWIQGRSSNYLGIRVARIDRDAATYFGLQKAQGALVDQVTMGSPAAESGMREMDILLSFNGISIRNESHFRFLLAQAQAGHPIDVELLRPRGGNPAERIHLSIMLTDSDLVPTSSPEIEMKTPSRTRMLGITVVPLTEELAQHLKLPKDFAGVAVLDVEPNSPADAKGIHVGDILVELNAQKVKDIPELLEALNLPAKNQETHSGEKQRDVVMLRIIRNGQNFGYKFIPR